MAVVAACFKIDILFCSSLIFVTPHLCAGEFLLGPSSVMWYFVFFAEEERELLAWSNMLLLVC